MNGSSKAGDACPARHGPHRPLAPGSLGIVIVAASDAERERLVADFVRFCEIESPSGRERAMADAVSAELRELGLEVEEDDTTGETGSDAGNLLARILQREWAADRH